MIVEVLNLTYSQIKSIASQQCIRESDVPVNSIIGMRYHVNKVEGSDVYIKGWGFGGFIESLDINQVKIIDL